MKRNQRIYQIKFCTHQIRPLSSAAVPLHHNQLIHVTAVFWVQSCANVRLVNHNHTIQREVIAILFIILLYFNYKLNLIV